LTNDLYSINQPYLERKHVISAYDEFIMERIKNSVGEFYYISFMFNHLPGRQAAKIEQMTKEVTRFHDILTHHIVRKRESVGWSELSPVMIGLPDFPVWKHAKVSIRTLQVNDGLHFNAIAILPSRFSRSRCRKYPQRKQSRLTVSLSAHVSSKPQLYLTDKLHRIHVERITEGTMVDYAFKTFKKGYVSADDILILR
jgi:hypothetical protein